LFLKHLKTAMVNNSAVPWCWPLGAQSRHQTQECRCRKHRYIYICNLYYYNHLIITKTVHI
jgi:hypothetical protein